jgi:hypothetical protein
MFEALLAWQCIEPVAQAVVAMSFTMRGTVSAGTTEVPGPSSKAALSRPRCTAGSASRRSVVVFAQSSSGSSRGKQAAAAAAASEQRVSNAQPATPSAAAAPSSSSSTRPLCNGGNAVEEEALASALRTVKLHESGQLSSRRLCFDCGNVLEAAYDRCGEVTEDYGRTFYMGALLRRPASRSRRGGASPALPGHLFCS